MVDKVVPLSSFRAQKRSDLKILLNIHDEISKIDDPGLRHYFETAWHQGAKIASEIYPVS